MKCDKNICLVRTNWELQLDTRNKKWDVSHIELNTDQLRVVKVIDVYIPLYIAGNRLHSHIFIYTFCNPCVGMCMMTDMLVLINYQLHIKYARISHNYYYIYTWSCNTGLVVPNNNNRNRKSYSIHAIAKALRISAARKIRHSAKCTF